MVEAERDLHTIYAKVKESLLSEQGSDPRFPIPTVQLFEGQRAEAVWENDTVGSISVQMLTSLAETARQAQVFVCARVVCVCV